MHPGKYQNLAAASGRPERPAEALLNGSGASDYLLKHWGIRRARATLAKLRCVGGGPEYVLIGDRSVGYRPAALDAWADSLISRPLRSTSEAA